MPLRVKPILGEESTRLAGRRVFLSASIPDPSRWDGFYDPLAITDVVVAVTRGLLTFGGALVTAAHPTIAPLVLYVAREFPSPRVREPFAIVYQSRLFEDVLPGETHELASGGFAELRWTEASPGDSPEPGRWNDSLQVMRQTMLEDSAPEAAVFVGGMQGIRDEFTMWKDWSAKAPVYVFRTPGGAAAELPQVSSWLTTSIERRTSFPTLARRIVRDLAGG